MSNSPDKNDKRLHRVFKTERRNIKFPLWRKKVDASLFTEKAILIPKYFLSVWGIVKKFKSVNSKSNNKSNIKILFHGSEELIEFSGHITHQGGERKDAYRIWFNSDLADQLKETYVMTFMRVLEFKLGKYAETAEERVNIEDEIPFFEFLDVEFDGKTKTLHLYPHYLQKPIFPSLFRKIVDSTVLKSIDLNLKGKEDLKIIPSKKWYKKSQLARHKDALNVIYFLLDVENKEVYVGEATSLVKRLGVARPEIPDWTHFRYEVLPTPLAEYRVEIERLVIRGLLNLLSGATTEDGSADFSEYRLRNKKT